MNRLKLHSSQLIPLLISVILILVASSMGYLQIQALSQLENNQNKSHEALSYFIEIGADLSRFHIQISELLYSAQDAEDEGVFYDNSKPFLTKIHNLGADLQTFKDEHGGALKLHESLASLDNDVYLYRQNTKNAILMVTVDLNLAKDLLYDSTKYYVELNNSVLDITKRINLHIINQSSIYYSKFSDTLMAALMIMLGLIAVGIYWSRR